MVHGSRTREPMICGVSGDGVTPPTLGGTEARGRSEPDIASIPAKPQHGRCHRAIAVTCLPRSHRHIFRARKRKAASGWREGLSVAAATGRGAGPACQTGPTRAFHGQVSKGAAPVTGP